MVVLAKRSRLKRYSANIEASMTEASERVVWNNSRLQANWQVVEGYGMAHAQG